MAKIELMGKFTSIGMRRKVEEEGALIINTCGRNDTSERGTKESWSWCNPTNRAIKHPCGTDQTLIAVSVECLWQGTKIFKEGGRPDQKTLDGDWRRGKAKRPIGAWAGEKEPLITTPGQARMMIYRPAFMRLVDHWLKDDEVAGWVEDARNHKGNVYLRDHDVGRGIHRNGAMSHAWLLSVYLNTGEWPS